MTQFDEVKIADLGEALRIIRGFATARSTPDGDVPVMSVAMLRNGTPSKNFADRQTLQEVGTPAVQVGDVLVAVEGGTVGETLVVPEEFEEFVPSQQAATLRVLDDGRIDPAYLGAWMTTEMARDQVRRLARGSGIQRVPVRDLAALTIPLPSIADQREIGRRYLVFEHAIQSHRAATACLEDLRDVDLLLAFAQSHAPASAGAESSTRGAGSHGS